MARHWPLWAFTPALCVAMVSRLDPLFIAGKTREEWMRCCVAQVRAIIGARAKHDQLSLPRAHASSLYERGLNAAFCAMQAAELFRATTLPAGSPWRASHLHALVRLGYQHGVYIRHATKRSGGRSNPQADVLGEASAQSSAASLQKSSRP